MSQDFIGAILTLALMFSLSWNIVLGCSWLKFYHEREDNRTDCKECGRLFLTEESK